MTEQIRPAELSDAGQIADVQTWTWREAYAGQLPAAFLAARVVSSEHWRGILADPGARTSNWVSLADDVVVGFASAGPDLDEPDLGCLYAIYVRAARQGRGLGYRLHEAAMESLVAAGFVEATVWSLATNSSTLAFYERQGWLLDGTARTDTSKGVPMSIVR